MGMGFLKAFVLYTFFQGQATFYLAELFRQATFYLEELFRQITFSKSNQDSKIGVAQYNGCSRNPRGENVIISDSNGAKQSTSDSKQEVIQNLGIYSLVVIILIFSLRTLNQI